MKPTKPRQQKYPRINLAFYHGNLDYVREAAWQNRMSITEYINFLIDKDRRQQNFAKKEALVHELISENDEITVVDPEGPYMPIQAGTYYGEYFPDLTKGRGEGQKLTRNVNKEGS